MDPIQNVRQASGETTSPTSDVDAADLFSTGSIWGKRSWTLGQHAK